MEEKHVTNAIQSQIYECALLNVLVILTVLQHENKRISHSFKHFKSKMYVKGMEYNFRNDAIRWQMTNLQE